LNTVKARKLGVPDMTTTVLTHVRAALVSRHLPVPGVLRQHRRGERHVLHGDFPLVGLLAAALVLPEVYGYVEVRCTAVRDSSRLPTAAVSTTRAA